MVAVVLIGVGLWSFYKLFYKEKVHSRPHIHSGDEVYVHQHDHGHSHDGHAKKSTRNANTSSFSIGILHGLAGVAHFILLLPALGLETRFESAMYIVGFAIGTVLAMTCYTYLLGLVTKKSSNNRTLLTSIRVAGGSFALIIGVYWMFLTL
jgi:ABC-type nickel/cobalt efflux system permease component RcnA